MNSGQGTAIKEGYRKAEDGGLGADEWAEIHFKGYVTFLRQCFSCQRHLNMHRD
jgi:hypothetical protein